MKIKVSLLHDCIRKIFGINMSKTDLLNFDLQRWNVCCEISTDSQKLMKLYKDQELDLIDLQMFKKPRRVFIDFKDPKWVKACNEEGVNFAKYDTDLYKRVLARYEGKKVVGAPNIRNKNIAFDAWSEALSSFGIDVLLENDTRKQLLFDKFNELVKEKLKENKESKEKLKENKKQYLIDKYNALSPRTKKTIDDRKNSISAGW